MRSLPDVKNGLSREGYGHSPKSKTMESPAKKTIEKATVRRQMPVVKRSETDTLLRRKRPIPAARIKKDEEIT
jgi:hypothetical protein